MWPEHIKNVCICRDSKAASKQASGVSGMHYTSLFSFISRVLNFAIFPKSQKSLSLIIAKLSEDEVLVEFFLAFRGIDVLIEESTASWRTRPYFRGIMWLIRRLRLSKSLYGERWPEVKQPKSDALLMLGNHLFASRSSKSYEVKTCLVANLQVRE